MDFKKITALLLVVIAMVSCDAARNVAGAYNMVNCKYSYKSISNVSISGVNVSNGSGLSVTSVAKLTSILTGTATSIPVNFTLNLDVNNPNSSDAFLNGLQYVISVDNVQLTTGAIDQALNVASGQTRSLPLTIGLDLAPLMTNSTKDTMLNVAKNLAGMGTQKSNITIQLKPSFLIGNTSVASPVYIPVNFSIGG